MHKTLSKKLEDNAYDYPLIKEFYLPIIQEHQAKYDDLYKEGQVDVNDWLLFVLFLDLYEQNENAEARLKKIEQDLNVIKNTLRELEFARLKEDFIKHSMHPVIYNAIKKVYDFYSELQAILYFWKKGYRVERIPTSNGQHGKRADLRVIKNEESAVVECKYIHQSNQAESFLSLYIRFYNKLYSDSNSPMLFSYEFSYNFTSLSELKQQHVNQLKHALNRAKKGEKLFSQSLGDTLKIDYQKEKEIGSGYRIGYLIDYVTYKLENFLKGCSAKQGKRASKQIDQTAKEGEKKYIFVLINLDDEFKIPFEEVDKVKKDVLENYRKNHGLTVDDIIILSW